MKRDDEKEPELGRVSDKSKRRLHLIVNSKSGQGQGESLLQFAQKHCEENQTELLCYQMSSPKDLEIEAKRAVEAAEKYLDDVIVVAGGDGTVRSVAGQVYGHVVKMAVIPLGTFNFFARTHQIPENPEEALKLALVGPAKKIRLGKINNEIFLINCNLGLYAKSILAREKATKKFGRKQFIVIFSTILSLLRRHRLLHVFLKVENVTREIRTPMIFIGNNALQMRNLSLSTAKGFRRDLLAVVTLKPVRGWEMLRVIFRGIFKTLENEERLNQFSTDSLIIQTRRNPQVVALDGEIFNMMSPFEVRSLPDALELIVPPEVVGDLST